MIKIFQSNVELGQLAVTTIPAKAKVTIKDEFNFFFAVMINCFLVKDTKQIGKFVPLPAKFCLKGKAAISVKKMEEDVSILLRTNFFKYRFLSHCYWLSWYCCWYTMCNNHFSQGIASLASLQGMKCWCKDIEKLLKQPSLMTTAFTRKHTKNICIIFLAIFLAFPNLRRI